MVGVSKTFTNQKKVLNNIYLSFFYGAKIGIIGLNGSGKSTLMKIIAGIDKNYQGEVVFAPGYSVGYLEQEPQLDDSKTVKEIVEPEMGIAGAAIATVISRYLELAIVAFWAHRHTQKFPFIPGLYRSLRIPGKLMKQMMAKVAPLILNEALWSTAITFQNQCYSTCGLAVVSALNIVSTLNNMATVAASALSVS